MNEISNESVMSFLRKAESEIPEEVRLLHEESVELSEQIGARLNLLQSEFFRDEMVPFGRAINTLIEEATRYGKHTDVDRLRDLIGKLRDISGILSEKQMDVEKLDEILAEFLVDKLSNFKETIDERIEEKAREKMSTGSAEHSEDEYNRILSELKEKILPIINEMDINDVNEVPIGSKTKFLMTMESEMTGLFFPVGRHWIHSILSYYEKGNK